MSTSAEPGALSDEATTGGRRFIPSVEERMAEGQAQDQTRLPEVVPIRYGRMLASPFTFLRGSATVMAHDLAKTPATGLTVQACGDAHLSNFGGYATPERNLVVASRDNGFPASDGAAAAAAAVRSYRERMAELAPMTHLAVWYTRIASED